MKALTVLGAAAVLTAASPVASIVVDYPLDGSIFPPDMAAPTFLWRDSAQTATAWRIEVSFPDGSPAIQVNARGERARAGEIDPRCIAPTNQLPQPADARTWTPDEAVWDAIKKHRDARIAIAGLRGNQPVSGGEVTIHTAADPVGAPIFYRDVPLMPSELQKGIIKPISPKMLPFVAWRLRYVNEPASRLIMEGIHTCANCHSFSQDGKVVGLDLDGPHNEKGLYAIVPVSRHTLIRDQDVISWKSFRNQTANDKRIGFMSQVSPDGRYVVTATEVEYYVANFADYRFLQVFYPTRGILAWYSRADGRMRALPGADDSRYVQANAVWSPDGKYLVFARAEARDSYPEGRELAAFANDPNEVQIQYDLYRIPFNDGNGGRAVPIAGASRNGMSNSFPKISPDGRWIVFVQSRNGQLMRPDGQLYIVPAAGGQARRMKCNTPLMNSWHSFSLNGRWMVFASKSRSPYTQMFLTHIDEQGNDSPAILIENATAANRAANIPEFVNIAPGSLLKMEAPAAEFYRLYDVAWELSEQGQLDAALREWTRALQLEPGDPKALNNFAAVLLKQGKVEEAAVLLEKLVEADPRFANARDNLGLVLLQKGKLDEAIAQWRRSLEINPQSTEAHANLGYAFLQRGRFQEAAAEWREALRMEPNRLPVLCNLAWLLATCPRAHVRNGAEAVALAEHALKLSRPDDSMVLDILGAAYAEAGRFSDAIAATGRAYALAARRNDTQLAGELAARLALYRKRQAFRTTN